MVLLGLLSSLQRDLQQWIHRQPQPLWASESPGHTLYWIPSRPRSPILLLPDDVLRRHRLPDSWGRRRTWPRRPEHGFLLLLGYFGLLPHGLLGMEPQRLGFQEWSPRLCWRCPCRDRFRCLGSRLFLGPWPPKRKDDDELPTPQHLSHHPRHRSSMVWMAGIQRRIRLWSQPSSRHGLLELMPHGHVRSHDLVSP